jgi:HlyD family secretion protein
MPDAEKLQVRVRVHESKIARVKKGQPVALRFDALPDSEFGGTVLSVANTPQPGAWPNTDRTTYDVIVSVETPAPQLKIGLTCVAEIDVSK